MYAMTLFLRIVYVKNCKLLLQPVIYKHTLLRPLLVNITIVV